MSLREQTGQRNAFFPPHRKGKIERKWQKSGESTGGAQNSGEKHTVGQRLLFPLFTTLSASLPNFSGKAQNAVLGPLFLVKKADKYCNPRNFFMSSNAPVTPNAGKEKNLSRSSKEK